MEFTQEQLAHRAEFVAALRSGEFLPLVGGGVVRKGECYCPTGVADEVYRRAHPDCPGWAPNDSGLEEGSWSPDDSQYHPERVERGTGWGFQARPDDDIVEGCMTPPWAVEEWFGFNEYEVRHIQAAFDGLEVSFTEIADRIEAGEFIGEYHASRHGSGVPPIPPEMLAVAKEFLNRPEAE